MPFLLPEDEKLEVLDRYAIGMALPMAAFDAVGVLVKVWRTREVYETQGHVTLDENGREVLHFLVGTEAHRWQVTRPYLKQLKAIGKRFKVNVIDLMKVDLSMRIKRARGLTVVDDKVLVYVINTKPTEEDACMGVWFDISYKHSPAEKDIRGVLPSEQKQFDQVQESLTVDRWMPHACGACEKTDRKTQRHKKCAGCGKVFYCNAVCQKKAWKSHKKFCKK